MTNEEKKERKRENQNKYRKSDKGLMTEIRYQLKKETGEIHPELAETIFWLRKIKREIKNQS